MVDLINDGHLIGFWPLLEASGAPVWKNYSPARANMPSGISFDFHVLVGGGNADDEDHQSVWPGQEIIFNEQSGVYIKGLKLQGSTNLKGATAPAPFAKTPVLGMGVSQVREQTLAPPIANSGFTVGAWVYPRSDGWLAASSQGGFSPATDTWFVGYGRLHGLIGQAGTDLGWYMGVSGALAGATQFSNSQFGGPHELAGYVLIDQAGTAAPPNLRTPIESGRFTHLTFKFSYDILGLGLNNDVTLYKDGRLEATATTAQDLTLGTVVDDFPLTLGLATDGSQTTNVIEHVGGWGHLISGVYHFRRPLSDAEILELHQRGGLQPNFSIRDNTKEVLITDANLIAYYPFMNIGFPDVSKNHYGLYTEKDEGDRANGYVVGTGPFGFGGCLQDDTTPSDFLVLPSGAMSALSTSKSFTICGWVSPEWVANLRDDNLIVSFGSISTATTGGPSTGTVTNSTAGFALTYRTFGGQNKLTLEVYPIGDLTNNIIQITPSSELFIESAIGHYGIIYDDQTKGIALYLHGVQQGSGTLAHSLSDQLTRLVGSGYPIMFTNGIGNQIADSDTKGVLAGGGNNLWMGSHAVFGRPLRADEMRFLAQSGIELSSLWRTIYDPRLVGYWPCNDFKIDDILVSDKARVWENVPGDLLRGDTLAKWNRVYNTGDSSVFQNDGTSRVDLFKIRTVPPELVGEGNLGITSGIFGVQAGSFGAGELANNLSNRNSITNLITRYKPTFEERDLLPQNPLGEFIIGFEVTPSGNIPAIDATSHITQANQFWQNSLLHVYGNQGVGTGDGEFRSFLTTVNAGQGSGVTIVFTGKDGIATITPLVSGILPFGVPSNIMFHSKFAAPYLVAVDVANGTAEMQITLWINGQKVNARTLTCQNANMWSDQLPESSTVDWILQFGGYSSVDVYSTQLNVDGGLGEIYLRKIFLMKGIFFDNEIEALATSGIQEPVITGYSPNITTTQVTIADPNLEGYWRFNGFEGGTGLTTGGGSGTSDLSINNRHLDPVAQRYFELTADADIPALMRFIPGPLSQSDLAIRCSGVTLAGGTIANTVPNMIPPFAVSGAAFNSPQNGFSVGFMLAKRDDIAASTANVILTYGTLTSAVPNGSVADTTRSPNRGWAIVMDDAEALKMVMSTGGNMFLDNALDASYSGQVVCGTTNAGNPIDDDRNWNNHQQGDFGVGGLDYFNHYCWVYNSSDVTLRCYMNGLEVDKRVVPPVLSAWTNTTVTGPQVPILAETRMITFFSHQADTSNAWDFRQDSLIDDTSILTDVFYFSRALTASEVRYAALNGIDGAQGTEVSGLIGGYVHGQDIGSGLIGGYHRGLDVGSGLIGGFMPGGTLGSGLAGGYISGLIFANGTIGGFIQGSDVGSGLLGGYIFASEVGSGMIAGYIRGTDNASGILGGFVIGGFAASGLLGGLIFSAGMASGLIGGFILGGLQGELRFDAGFIVEVVAAEDFDAQLEIAKATTSDFDAKLIVVQNETPPIAEIIVPATQVGNFNTPYTQYFIAKASGTQNKTIVQGKWTFGDFGAPTIVSVSGGDSYPINHIFTSSGCYVAKFTAIDSNGMRMSDTVKINITQGIDPVIISLSGVPRSGDAELIVDFTTTIDSSPNGVGIISKLLDFDDGQSSIRLNPTHNYAVPSIYAPVWVVRDSRGVIWGDSLVRGPNNTE